MTALLKYTSEFSCCCIAVVKFEGTKKIFKDVWLISPYHHFIILTSHHYNIAPFKSHNKFCNTFSLPISPTSGKKYLYWFYFYPEEITFLVFLSSASSENNMLSPLSLQLSWDASGKFHYSNPWVHCRKQNSFYFST